MVFFCRAIVIKIYSRSLSSTLLNLSSLFPHTSEYYTLYSIYFVVFGFYLVKLFRFEVI